MLKFREYDESVNTQPKNVMTLNLYRTKSCNDTFKMPTVLEGSSDAICVSVSVRNMSLLKCGR
jgi:hypothetical protein